MKYFFYAAAVFFMVVGTLVALTISQKNERASTDSLNSRPRENKNIINPLNGGSIRVVEPGDYDFTAVVYRDDGFDPKTVELTQDESGLGCILKVINESSDELLIRLSPYDPAGRRGFSFSPVIPGEFIKMDPRHGDLKELYFHNRHKPEHEFLVKMDKNCFAPGIK